MFAKKRATCQNNPKNSYSLDLICLFDKTENQHYLYRGKDCIENFCKKLEQK